MANGNKRNPNIPKCDQCQMVAINGVNCHETGCPNSKKTWVPEREEWVLFLECSECGADVEEGEACGCDVDETHRDDGEDRDGNPLRTFKTDDGYTLRFVPVPVPSFPSVSGMTNRVTDSDGFWTDGDLEFASVNGLPVADDGTPISGRLVSE